MDYQTIAISIENNIAFITLNRPAALNAINRKMMSELYDFFENEGPKIADLKGVILTGAGDKSFVAGADITEFTSIESAAEASAMAQRGHDTFFKIEQFHRPVVAAVNGFALGAGCELAMACHLRIASEKARFGQPEVNLGLIPGYGGTQRLVQLIGKTKALELLLTADMISADEALRLGLVNHVVAAGNEIEKAIEIIEKIATKAPFAVSKIIESVNAFFSETGFGKEVSAFGDCASTADFREGAAAFVEKRKAHFSGK